MKTIVRSNALLLCAFLLLSGVRADAHHHHHHGHGHGWWGWGGWGGRAVTAWGDHLHFIGQARYLTAKANHENALAAQQWVRARAYAKLMHSMEIDLRRLNSEKYRISKARESLNNKAKSLNGIALGKVTYARSALIYFSGLPGFASLPIVADTESVGPFGPEHFVVNPERTRYIDGKMVVEKVEVETFDGGSVEEFVAWIAAKQYNVKVETGADGNLTPWQILMAVRAQVQEQIALTDKALKEEAKNDTADILQIWGESVWGEYGDGLLKDYRKAVEAAEAARG